MHQAERDRAAVGRSWADLPAPDRAAIVRTLEEIRKADTTLDEVWRFYRHHATTGATARKPIGEAIADLFAAKLAAGRRARYVEGLKAYLTKFAHGRETMPLARFTSADIEQWFDARAEKPATRASNLGRLSALFAFAKRRGWTADNVCDRVERITTDAHPPAIFTPDQVATALHFLRAKLPDFLPWFTLATFAGIRPEELDKLTWEDVNLDDALVTVNAAASKVRRRRIVHLQPVAIAWLRRRGPLPLPYVTRRRHLRRLRAHLGLARWPQDVLRHTAASHLLALWNDAGRVALELGNSPAILLRHYRELVTSEDSARFWALHPDALDNRARKGRHGAAKGKAKRG